MRALIILTTISVAHTAHANPTTQRCLGSFDAFLTCPAGAQRTRTECRARDAGHWSGSKRQGPALFLRRDGKTVSFAAYYKDHEKTGRVYRFDEQGRLESYADVANNKYNGISVSCMPDGRVKHLAYYKDDRVAGISRSWRASDGTFVYAMDHDANGRAIPVQATPAMMQRPDHLCRPQRCDVTTPPDLSGVPKDQSRSSAAPAASTEATR
jgi:hypothetical protein